VKRHRVVGQVAASSLVLTGAIVLAGCSDSVSSTTTTSSPAPLTVSTTSTTQTSPPSTTTTKSTLPPQTATQGFFYTPSKNISCELDSGGSTGQSAYCFSLTPPQHATMDASGVVQKCQGEMCLSNPPLGTPVMAYGTSMTLGPFTCLSATTGVTCTVSAGMGFKISTSGIVDVG
jgi:hypothetical protein